MYNFKTLKIMNLENLNLVELNAQEVKGTEGGFWHYLGGFAAWYLYETFDNVAASKASFNRGYNSI